jgi:hypothetical protein
MSPVTEKAGRIWTDAELQALPDEGFIHEVIDGELAGRRGRSSRLSFPSRRPFQKLGVVSSAKDRTRLHSAAILASETRY